MSVEEVFHLRKDTKVYIIFNPDSMDSQVKKLQTRNTFARYGYDYIKYQPYADPGENHGYRLTFRGEYNTKPELYTEKAKWYSFVNILRKIRKEETPVIITFAGNSLIKDISNKIEESSFEIIGYQYNLDNTKKADAKAGMYFTPLEARILFKDVILESEIKVDLDTFMITYYNQRKMAADEEKYKYWAICKV